MHSRTDHQPRSRPMSTRQRAPCDRSSPTSRCPLASPARFRTRPGSTTPTSSAETSTRSSARGRRPAPSSRASPNASSPGSSDHPTSRSRNGDSPSNHRPRDAPPATRTWPSALGLNVRSTRHEKEERTIARRLDEHRANVQATVDGIRSVAEELGAANLAHQLCRRSPIRLLYRLAVSRRCSCRTAAAMVSGGWWP